MLTLFPILMEWTSPRTTALNQTLHWSPITTSPTTVALSARKHSLPNCGVFPFTVFIRAIIKYGFNDMKLFYITDWAGIIEREMKPPAFFTFNSMHDNDVRNIDQVAKFTQFHRKNTFVKQRFCLAVKQFTTVKRSLQTQI